MKADATFKPSVASATSAENIGAILDKLSITKQLIQLQPIDSKLALALQLIDCASDRIAELADDGERARLRKAAMPVQRKRSFWDRLDGALAIGVIGVACLGVALWLAVSVLHHLGWRWL